MPIVSSCRYERSDYVIQPDKYALIRTFPEDSAEKVVYIHEIFYNDDRGAQNYDLLVTKYSVLKSTYPFQAEVSADNTGIDEKELLLHFGDFERMGTRDDAEILHVQDICSARDFVLGTEMSSDGVDYVLRPPLGESNCSKDRLGPALTFADLHGCEPFCRFGIRSTENRNDVCITPISNGLLRSHDRWRRRTFNGCNPLVFDCTPQVLGPSEGFSQAGYGIQAALGFDQEYHMTWKVCTPQQCETAFSKFGSKSYQMRHHSSQVYDGSSSLEVFDEFGSGVIQPPLLHGPPPTVALVAGEHQFFRLTDENKLMPSAEEFLKPWEIVVAATRSSLDPDFVVGLLSPTSLHPSTVRSFSKSILQLLERRLSVHIKLSPQCDHTSSLHRNLLIVVASPYCDSLPWDASGPFTDTDSYASGDDLISDLSFENPRTMPETSRGFVCSHPRQEFPGVEDDQQPKLIYNHQTGIYRDSARTNRRNALDTSTIYNSPRSMTHPTRKDFLTVRELARLQGFPDDFVFYGSNKLQYRDVCCALPPTVARTTGETILRVIRNSTVITVDDQRRNKRARQENQDEGT